MISFFITLWTGPGTVNLHQLRRCSWYVGIHQSSQEDRPLFFHFPSSSDAIEVSVYLLGMDTKMKDSILTTEPESNVFPFLRNRNWITDGKCLCETRLRCDRSVVAISLCPATSSAFRKLLKLLESILSENFARKMTLRCSILLGAMISSWSADDRTAFSYNSIATLSTFKLLSRESQFDWMMSRSVLSGFPLSGSRKDTYAQ